MTKIDNELELQELHEYLIELGYSDEEIEDEIDLLGVALGIAT